MVGSIFLLKLLNIFVISMLYNKQQQKDLFQNKPIKSIDKMPQKNKKTEKKICCCQEEMAKLLQNFSKKNYYIKITLTTGSTCCKISGLISDIRKKGCLLVLINTDTNAQWYIPIDKIAAIYVPCPCIKN